MIVYLIKNNNCGEDCRVLMKFRDADMESGKLTCLPLTISGNFNIWGIQYYRLCPLSCLDWGPITTNGRGSGWTKRNIHTEGVCTSSQATEDAESSTWWTNWTSFLLFSWSFLPMVYNDEGGCLRLNAGAQSLGDKRLVTTRESIQRGWNGRRYDKWRIQDDLYQQMVRRKMIRL